MKPALLLTYDKDTLILTQLVYVEDDHDFLEGPYVDTVPFVVGSNQDVTEASPETVSAWHKWWSSRDDITDPREGEPVRLERCAPHIEVRLADDEVMAWFKDREEAERFVTDIRWPRLPPRNTETGSFQREPTEQQILEFASSKWGERTWLRLAAKLSEETGEVAGAVGKIEEGRATYEDLDDELGDLLIVVSQFAARRHTTLEDLRRRRFEQIRERPDA